MPIAVRRVPPIHALAGHGATRRKIRREIPQSFQPALRVQVPAFAFVNDSANVLRASRSPPNSWDKFGDTRLQEYPVIHNHPQQNLPLVTACHTSEIVLSSVGESWFMPDYESAALPTELRQRAVVLAVIAKVVGGVHWQALPMTTARVHLLARGL